MVDYEEVIKCRGCCCTIGGYYGVEAANTSKRESKGRKHSKNSNRSGQVIDLIEKRIQVVREQLIEMIDSGEYDYEEILKVSEELDLLIIQSSGWSSE